MTSYETIDLAVDKETAARSVAERVPHLRRALTPDAIEFRTNAGFHLATITDARLPSGDAGSRLRYRTSLISPHLFHAHDEARQIRDAVEPFRVTRRRP